MYGYSEVRATCAATSSLYTITVGYQTYCQPDRKLQWVWLSNLALHGIHLLLTRSNKFSPKNLNRKNFSDGLFAVHLWNKEKNK